MLKKKIALLIGRFQPFHRGHAYALKKALEVADRVIIGIGSSQEEGTENNPWSYQIRKKMVEVSVEEMGIREKVKAIWPVPDFLGDEEWEKNVKLIIQREKFQLKDVVVVSNNEWTTRVLKEAGMNIYEQGYDNRNEWEGYKIREILRNGGTEWRGRVSEGVGKIIEEQPLI